MALLLNVRRLSQSASNVKSSIEASFLPESHIKQDDSKRNDSTLALVESGDDERFGPSPPPVEDEQSHGAFSNPNFQEDVSSDENSNYPSSDGHLTDYADDQRRRISTLDLSSADSGINVGCNVNAIDDKKISSTYNDVTSYASDRSLDSGVHVPSDEYLNKINNNRHSFHRPSGRKLSTPSKLPTPPKQPSFKKDVEKQALEHEESLLAICIQVFFPFLVAGIGTCGAGLVLDNVEEWEVFKTVSELFILVPTLLGLKGNLEMTLASRVSTQVNLGKVQTWADRWSVCWGNMALVQCQATVMALLASCFATAMSAANNKPFDLDRAMLLGGSALFTASLASLILGGLTLAVVLMSHKLSINPDNVATPLAASIGDVTTLGILAAIASYLRDFQGNYLPSSLCIGVFMLLVPVWAYMSYKNLYVRRVLFTGWTPVIAAVAITSAGGYILEFSVTQYKGLAIFQPVINGVAGNLVAVQASRISTYFHAHSVPGSRPPDGSALCMTPFAPFFSKSPHARTARVLMCMVIPGHLLFGYGITWIKGGDTALTPSFLPIYLTTAIIQVAALLYLAQCLIHFLWLFKIDPDNSAIPLLTALGDLSGMVALTLAFFLHRTFVSVPMEDTTISTLDTNSTFPFTLSPMTTTLS